MNFGLTVLFYHYIGVYYICEPASMHVPYNSQNKETNFSLAQNLSAINLFKPSGVRNLVKAAVENQFHYSYGNSTFGPSSWRSRFPECNGEKQSPIDIKLGNLFEIRFPSLRFSESYYSMPFTMEMMNNKHSVQLTAHYETAIPFISGGPLRSYNYFFEEMHFHWGTSDTQGSEHSVDGSFFPMEMHLLHRRQEKKANARNEEKASKFAVIAYFFNISRQANKLMDPIVEALNTVMAEPMIRHSLNHTFPLADLIQPFQNQYVAYSGSRTSPPCLESVLWLISSHPLAISRSQLKAFRKLFSLVPDMMDNHRPVQNVGSRTIFYAT